MENQDYDALETHFITYGSSKLRGLVRDNSIIGYAAYVLDRIAPQKGSTMLDVGCGDGLMMQAMLMLRPDLHIDGIELSPKLSEFAGINNPQAEIVQGNIMIMDITNIPKKYDYIFSFSFLQYIPANDIAHLQSLIKDLLVDNGVIVHMSIPDKRLRLADTIVNQLRKRGIVGLLIAPLLNLLYLLYQKDRYGIGGFWHNPLRIKRNLSELGEIEVLESDVYYRFDLVHKISS